MNNLSTLDLRTLRAFLTIVETESFTGAAKRLGVSQSAISQQISALERDLNIKVLRRTGGGAKPTLAGEVLVQYARQILRKAEEARRMLAEFDSTAVGRLNIGAPHPVSSYLLPPVISGFRGRFPKCELHLEGGHSRRIVTRLLGADLDIGIVLLPVDEPQLRFVDVGHDELVAIAPRGHAWAARNRVHPQDFAEQALILWGPRCQSSQSIQSVLLQSGVFPQVAIYLDHLEPVANFVAAGLGVAVVPLWSVLEEEKRGDIVVRSIGKTGLSRHWAVAYRERSQRSQDLHAFIRLCADELPGRFSPEVGWQERSA